jgi:hypothetical protein
VVSLGNAQNQIEFVVMSAGRSRWKAYVAHQPGGLASRNGAFRASAVPAPAAATATAPRRSRAASRSATSGSRKNPGYSLSAAPTPSSAAATAGRPRHQAYTAAANAAVTSRSQFRKAYPASAGAAAQTSARRPAIRASSHPVSSPNGASSSAEAARNCASLRANWPVNQMNMPVSTGYSIAPPTSWSPARWPCR